MKAVERFHHPDDPQENENIALDPVNQEPVNQLGEKRLAGWQGAKPAAQSSE